MQQMLKSIRNALRATIGLSVPMPQLQKAAEPLTEVMPAFTLCPLSPSLTLGIDSSTSAGLQQAHCPHSQEEKTSRGIPETAKTAP